jgi:hypothetical protein
MMPKWPPRTGSDWVIWSIFGVMGVFVALVAIAAAVAPADENGNISPNSDSSNGVDASGLLACDAFFDLLENFDLMTFTEQRNKAKEVNDKARTSSSAVIRREARNILAAFTSNDPDALGLAGPILVDACRDIGY